MIGPEAMRFPSTDGSADQARCDDLTDGHGSSKSDGMRHRRSTCAERLRLESQLDRISDGRQRVVTTTGAVGQVERVNMAFFRP